MRSRLSLVADRELPEHLIADTEHALTHLGWLGVRRRAHLDGEIHVLHLDGFVPPVTLSHAGHDHAEMLADLRSGWTSLGVACAVLEGDPVSLEGDPAIAAVRLLQSLSPGARGTDLHEDLAARWAALESTDPAEPGELPAVARELVLAAGSARDAVHVAGTLLGLRPV